MFLLAAGPTVVGFGLYNVSLSYLPSSVANLVVTLEPAFTALIAYFVLYERLTWIQLIVGVLILVGTQLIINWILIRTLGELSKREENAGLKPQADL